MPEATSFAPSPDLHPTLWRTCRALANRQRLQILDVLFRQPDQSVSAVAEALGISTGTASQYLRLLNSRGLLRARRVHRYVVYRVEPNPSIAGTNEIVRALKDSFARARQPVTTIFQLATAFTHQRRIQIVQALGDTSLGFTDLKRRTGISHDALRRHLAKLEDRRMVSSDQSGPVEQWRLGRPRGRLARTLVQLARSE